MIENIEFDGIDYVDWPDMVDTYISYAERDGVPLTDDQLDEINDDRDFVYEELMKHLF